MLICLMSSPLSLPSFLLQARALKSPLTPPTSHHRPCHPVTKSCLLSFSGVCSLCPKPTALVHTPLLLGWFLVAATYQVPLNSSPGSTECPSDHSKK